MYIMGENPAMSDPDVDHAREALAALDHLVVQDIFLTETAYLADVVLPATAWPEKIGTVTNTDRMVQLGRKAIEPPGDAQAGPLDHQRARRAAWACDWHYAHPREVFDEMRHVHGLDRRHHLGAPRARVVGHLSVRERGRPGRAGGVRRRLPDARPAARRFVPADLISGRRAARRASIRWC